MPIPKEIKQEWINALRSGKYTKGQDALMQITKDESDGHIKLCYCVLGVYADIIKYRVGIDWEYDTKRNLFSFNHTVGNIDLPPSCFDYAIRLRDQLK